MCKPDKSSPRIDFVVIKKDAAIVINNDIGRGFKRYNIIEYKNPDDALNTDIIWKCIGYASLYKALGKNTDAIPEEELTISVFRSRYPRKFFEYCKRQNRRVEQEAPGVFLVEGFSALTLRVIVTKSIRDDALLALRIMMPDAGEEEIRRFVLEARDKAQSGLQEDYLVVLKISASVNRGLFEKVREEKAMKTWIDELYEARENALAESRAEGIAEGRVEGRAEGRAEGIAKGEEKKEVENIRSLMETMSLTAKEAMNALKISAGKQKRYLTML